MKICKSCSETKPFDNFSRCSRQGYQSKCKSCKSAYYKENKKEIAKKRREYYLKEKDTPEYKARIRDTHLKYTYGISLNCYTDMLTEQGGSCKICLSTETKNSSTDMFAVDHCHDTGQVRGLLCDKCNRGLGFLEDNIGTLKNAIKYLEDSNAIQRERDRGICVEK